MPYLDDLIENLEQSGSRSEIEIHDDRIDAAEALRAYRRAYRPGANHRRQRESW